MIRVISTRVWKIAALLIRSSALSVARKDFLLLWQLVIEMNSHLIATTLNRQHAWTNFPRIH